MKTIKLTYEVTKCSFCPLQEKIWQSRAGNRYTMHCSLTGTEIVDFEKLNADCPIEDDEAYEYPNTLVERCFK